VIAPALFFWAARALQLRAVALAVFAALSPPAAAGPDAPVIADAIAFAVAADPSPTWEPEMLAAVMAVSVVEESGVRLHPVPWIDPKTGRPVDALAHGPFQIRGTHGFGGVGDQAEYWLVLLRAGARACPVSPSAPLLGACDGKARRIADWRFARAKQLLEQLRQSEGVASAQSPEGSLQP
jgi:hypothetical protein